MIAKQACHKGEKGANFAHSACDKWLLFAGLLA